MEKRYYKWYSSNLNRDMEYNVYGNGGRIVIVFPAQDGRFYDYENFGMVDVLADEVNSGRLQLVCIDSIDKETWSDKDGDPAYRMQMQEKWVRYITEEVVPAVCAENPQSRGLITTGCSMGATHAANFFFRRPDIFDTVIALSGLYHAGYFMQGYMDSLVYENSPMDFIPNMPVDHPYIEKYKNSDIIICVGQGAWEEDLIASTRRLDTVLWRKGIPAWFDYWGFDVNHDWPWWRKQIRYFVNTLESQGKI